LQKNSGIEWEEDEENEEGWRRRKEFEEFRIRNLTHFVAGRGRMVLV
jgi:hypothetical protein